jgi:hypothetical protein
LKIEDWIVDIKHKSGNEFLRGGIQHKQLHIQVSTCVDAGLAPNILLITIKVPEGGRLAKPCCGLQSIYTGNEIFDWEQNRG